MPAPAATALDPRTVPDEVTIYFDLPGRTARQGGGDGSALSAAAAAAAASGGRLAVFEAADVVAFSLALRRLSLLTDLAADILTNYRCSCRVLWTCSPMRLQARVQPLRRTACTCAAIQADSEAQMEAETAREVCFLSDGND